MILHKAKMLNNNLKVERKALPTEFRHGRFNLRLHKFQDYCVACRNEEEFLRNEKRNYFGRVNRAGRRFVAGKF
jgi:hypothetical protein